MMRSRSCHALAGAALALALAGPTANRLSAQLPGEVRVEVRDAGSGRPLADVEITTPGGFGAARTDPHGRALLRGLAPGPHTVRALRLGYAPAEAEVAVENGRTADLLLRLVPAPLDLGGIDVAVEGLPPGASILRPGDADPGARDVADLVEGAPGVRVVRRGGPGSPAVPVIRGSAGDQVLVLVDGVALNSPLTGEADLSQIRLEETERVVVIPGARAGRFGPGALAGAILVETTSLRSSSVAATVEAGAMGRVGAHVSATFAGAATPWSLAAGGGWRRSDGAFEHTVPDVRGGGTARRENAWARSASGFAEGAWNRPGGPAVRLRVHARDTRRGSPGTVVQPSLTGLNEQRRLGALLQVERDGGRRGWRGSLGLERHRALAADPSPPFGPSYEARSRVRQTEARGEAWIPAGPLRLRGGADVRLLHIRASALGGDAPTRLDGGGAWAEASWTGGRTGNRWIQAAGTLRGDVHELLDGAVLSPSLSVLLGRGGTTLEASVGSALSPAGIADLFFQEGVLTRANPDLGPERVRAEATVEAARRFTGEPFAGEIRLAAFQADVDGMVLWFPDHRFVWSPRNVDVARRGLEASAEVRRAFLAPLRVSVTWTEVAYDEGTLDGQVVYRPRFEADVSARVPTGGVTWSAAWRRVGARRTRPGSSLNALPPYDRLDLGATARLDAGPVDAAFDVAVTNVLDAPAALLVDYPLPGRAWSIQVRLHPDGR